MVLSKKLLVRDYQTLTIFMWLVTVKKKDLFQNIKFKVFKLCRLCTSWEHNTTECKVDLNCKKCNVAHAGNVCALEILTNCPAVSAVW